MLGQVAREADQPARQHHRLAQRAVGGVEAGLAEMWRLVDRLAAPAPEGAGQLVDRVLS